MGEGPFHLGTSLGTGGRYARPPFLISSRMIAVAPRMTASATSRIVRRSILVFRRAGSGCPRALVRFTGPLPDHPRILGGRSPVDRPRGTIALGQGRTAVRDLPSRCLRLAADSSLWPGLGLSAALQAITEPLQKVSPASRYCADARASVRANRDIAAFGKVSFCLLVRRVIPAVRDTAV